MLQQPRVPPTGQRQAIEIAIKWREVLAQKEALLKIMSRHTGHSVDKLDKVGIGLRVPGTACIGLGSSTHCMDAGHYLLGAEGNLTFCGG